MSLSESEARVSRDRSCGKLIDHPRGMEGRAHDKGTQETGIGRFEIAKNSCDYHPAEFVCNPYEERRPRRDHDSTTIPGNFPWPLLISRAALRNNEKRADTRGNNSRAARVSRPPSSSPSSPFSKPAKKRRNIEITRVSSWTEKPSVRSIDQSGKAKWTVNRLVRRYRLHRWSWHGVDGRNLWR